MPPGSLLVGAGVVLTGVGFFAMRWSPEAVILSAAKDLRSAHPEILRCAQDDTSRLAGSFPKKPTPVSGGGVDAGWGACAAHIAIRPNQSTRVGALAPPFFA